MSIPRVARWTSALCHRTIPAAMVLAALVFPLRPGASPAHATVGAASTWAAAWPMVGHDPQRTNRSQSIGPLHPRLLFTVADIYASPLIGPNGNIYGWGKRGLAAFSAAGHLLWTARSEEYEGGPPVLASNGLLIANGLFPAGSTTHPAAMAMAVGALSLTGMRAWQIPFKRNSKTVAPLVTADNLLYMPFVGPATPNLGLEVVSPTGVPQRQLLPHFAPSAVALAHDGTVYELGGQGSLSLRALTPTGLAQWARALTYHAEISVGLLVGKDGVIYVSDGNGVGSGVPAEVAAYTPAGRLLWRLPTADGAEALAERTDGAVLAVGATELRAISPRGNELWTYPLGQPHGSAVAAATLPSIAVDTAGHAYVGARDGTIRAFSTAGALLWTLRIPSPLGAPSLALSADGRLVVAGTDGLLRAYR